MTKSKKNKKNKKIKPRNFVVEAMVLSCKPHAFVDGKKEKNKKLCRKEINLIKNGYSD
jgi:hypothetical protein